jgi:uncharacterized protein YjiK
MKLILLFLIAVYTFTVDACKSTTNDKKNLPPNEVNIGGVHYNIHDIDRTIVLARELVEVSGLVFDTKQSTLLAVNDELGYLYELSTTSGEILSKKKFADIGDYEGLALINDEVVIARSNGKLFFYNPSINGNSTIIRTSLSTSNNVEGITYLPYENTLLIACKGSPRIPGKYEEKKGKLICSLNLGDKLMDKDPYLLIKDKQLKQSIKSIYGNLNLTDVQLKNLESRVESFSPSGLAIHPITEELYILSAKGSLLVVVGKDKGLKHIHFLDKDFHIQPEGICFAPNGDMFIGNEGQNGSGKIHVYHYQE